MQLRKLFGLRYPEFSALYHQSQRLLGNYRGGLSRFKRDMVAALKAALPRDRAGIV